MTEFLYVFFDGIQKLADILGFVYWDFGGEFCLFGGAHTEILDGFGDYELIGHKDHRTLFVGEFRVGEGDLFHKTFVSFHSDSISDLEILAEYER